MKKVFYLIVLSAIIAIVSCGGKKNAPQAMPKADNGFADDKMIYGLACDGCTDSVVYLLPEDGSDPVKYDIIDAHRLHKVIGRLKVGDWIALLRNPQDSTVADYVVDLDELKGTWCYVVMPKMRDYDKMSKKQQSRMMRDMPDSLKETYLIPREYGFTLKNNFAAQPVGMVRAQSSLEDESPVVYPVLPMYQSWHMLNGKLVLSHPKNDAMMPGTTTAKGKKIAMVNDTVDILFLGDDSLVLQFPKVTRSYYRLSDAADANKLAREKAEKIARDAEKQIKEQ